jgi:hypothetical protein
MVHFSVLCQGRAVGCEVVSDKLAEERPASFDPGVLRAGKGSGFRMGVSSGSGGIVSTCVAEATGCPDAAQDVLVHSERWQVEHSSVTSDCTDRRVHPARCRVSFAACLG